ncbi:hypothetical protein FHU36_003829 [Nonomuraea muscovyensis]|uniref:Uncharacterized protein n=1 Tax=Nonomuraea muscovyensis TaxID=1124761 RepID=A0A7X0EZ95_9ACTN|nr:hypothetical protein [Nonomuraea muscovyensis]MBB6347284.1 hypothetical protein [Nonomuraea muscovyensis]
MTGLLAERRKGSGAVGDAGEGGHAEVDGGSAASSFVELSELVFGASQADAKSFDLAERAFAFSLGDAGFEVVADLGDAVALLG